MPIKGSTITKKGKKLQYEILEHLGTLSTGSTGWSREVNVVKWGENPAKIDIRAWNEDHTMAGRGITLTDEEATALARIIQEEF